MSCSQSNCGPNTQCIISGDTFRCVCIDGYIESPNTFHGCIKSINPCNPSPCAANVSILFQLCQLKQMQSRFVLFSGCLWHNQGCSMYDIIHLRRMCLIKLITLTKYFRLLSIRNGWEPLHQLHRVRYFALPTWSMWRK